MDAVTDDDTARMATDQTGPFSLGIFMNEEQQPDIESSSWLKYRLAVDS